MTAYTFRTKNVGWREVTFSADLPLAFSRASVKIFAGPCHHRRQILIKTYLAIMRQCSHSRTGCRHLCLERDLMSFSLLLSHHFRISVLFLHFILVFRMSCVLFHMSVFLNLCFESHLVFKISFFRHVIHLIA